MEKMRQILCSSCFPGQSPFLFVFGFFAFILPSAFKLTFNQLPLIIGYWYVLVVCMFSRWVEASPCQKSNALTVAKKLLENVCLSWGTPSTISSVQGIPFTKQIIQTLMVSLENFLKLSITSHNSLNHQAWLRD